MLDCEKEALDEVSLAIEGVIAGDLRRRFLGWYDRFGILGMDGVAEFRGVVSLVAKNMLRRNVGDERLGLSEVAGLARRQDEAERIAQSIDDGMDFRGQATPRTADRTSFSPPFLPAAC